MKYHWPAGPATVPDNLTKPSSAYRFQAWLAMGGLALFVLLYFALAGWFVWTAYRLISMAMLGGNDDFIVCFYVLLVYPFAVYKRTIGAVQIFQ